MGETGKLLQYKRPISGTIFIICGCLVLVSIAIRVIDARLQGIFGAIVSDSPTY